jgi:hypothetical protein
VGAKISPRTGSRIELEGLFLLLLLRLRPAGEVEHRCLSRRNDSRGAMVANPAQCGLYCGSLWENRPQASPTCLPGMGQVGHAKPVLHLCPMSCSTAGCLTVQALPSFSPELTSAGAQMHSLMQAKHRL